jgi:hypothetical protein
MPNFLQIATALVEKGFSVIPLIAGDKRPLPGWGATRRTRDIEQLRSLFPNGEYANVGICADENVVILETDDLEQLCQVVRNGAGRELPITLMACGSSENRPHLFFKRTEMASNVGNLVVPGLFEARFFNQFVVGSGSVHPSGAVYRFLNDAPMVPIPDWLVSELARLALTQKTVGQSRRNVEVVSGKVPEGSRHYFLMRELGKMWDGTVSEEHLLEKAHELNALCDPPKDNAHVRQCVRDIMRRDPYNAGPKVLIGSGQAGTAETHSASHSAAAPPQSAQEKSWASISASDLCAKDLPPRKAVMSEGDAPLFYEKSVNQILAWRGVGKTCFALGLAGAIASGGGILDFVTDRPRRVLYLDGELPQEQLQERARSLIPASCRDSIQLFSPEMIAPPRSLNLITNGDANNLMRLVEKGNIEVLFIDSQSTTMGGDTNKTEFQEARQQLLMQLRWAGLTVIEMHHVGKEGKQRGLSRNDDILDVQMHLKKTPDWEPEDGLQFELVYEKVRHAARLESGYVVSLTDGQWLKRPSDDIQAVADMLKKRIDIKKIMKELKCSRSKFYRLQKKALAEGLIDSSIELQIGNLKVKKGVPA